MGTTARATVMRCLQALASHAGRAGLARMVVTPRVCSRAQRHLRQGCTGKVRAAGLQLEPEVTRLWPELGKELPQDGESANKELDLLWTS